MKLLYCKLCNSFVHLNAPFHKMHCSCGQTTGVMIDKNKYRYAGEHATPLHIDNDSFERAVERPQQNMPASFKAAVEPRKSYTWQKVDQL